MSGARRGHVAEPAVPTTAAEILGVVLLVVGGLCSVLAWQHTRSDLTARGPLAGLLDHLPALVAIGSALLGLVAMLARRRLPGWALLVASIVGVTAAALALAILLPRGGDLNDVGGPVLAAVGGLVVLTGRLPGA